MNLNQLDIIVSNVPQVCADLERILDKRQTMLTTVLLSSRLAVTVSMLSQNHLVPLENFQSGIILHIEVEDVDQNCKRLKEFGAEILHGPAITDWGTESLLVKGPAGLVIDFIV